MTSDGSAGAGRLSDEVAQASGMVSEQVGCSPDVAVVLMRKRAESSGLDLEDIARAVIDREIRFA